MSRAGANPASRLRRWIERRLPALTRLKSPESLPIQLHRKRIYILPTGFGLGFGVLLLVMLVGALNYANNAALLLTCLLGGATVNSMLGAFRVLDGLVFHGVRAEPAVAGDPVRIHLELDAHERSRNAIRLDGFGPQLAFSLIPGAREDAVLECSTARRGWMPLPRIRVSSTWPFGLFRAWSWIHPDSSVLVYPRPEASGPQPPQAPDTRDAPRPGEGDDLASLREYRAGDPLKRVAWKASARHEDLLVQELERPAPRPTATLAWHALAGLDAEQRIARLARWVAEAHAASRPWRLELPGAAYGPATGSEHFHRCMTALALLP